MLESRRSMPDATVAIATRNRCEEVMRAVASALAQTADVEVIVVDDASDDGTAERLREAFPEIEVIESPHSVGSLIHRNTMFARARSPVIISLDDDAELVSPRTIEQTLAEFDDPRIAAVGIPFFDAPAPTRLLQRATPDAGCVITDSFLGCVAALRRDAFLAVEGYDTTLHHSGEEPDLCARLLKRGWVVRLGSADVAIHHRSARRSTAFAARYATRNQLRFPLTHAPMPAGLTDLVAALLIAGLRAIVRRHPGAVAAGVREGLSGLRAIAREPMSAELYAVWRRLAREGLRRRQRTTLADIVSVLPALQAPIAVSRTGDRLTPPEPSAVRPTSV